MTREHIKRALIDGELLPCPFAIGDCVSVRHTPDKPWTFDWPEHETYVVVGIRLNSRGEYDLTIDDGVSPTDGFLPSDLAPALHPDPRIDALKRDVELQMRWKTEAQNERDNLADENARLREVLAKIGAQKHEPGCKFEFVPYEECPTCPSSAKIARAALQQGDKQGDKQ